MNQKLIVLPADFWRVLFDVRMMHSDRIVLWDRDEMVMLTRHQWPSLDDRRFERELLGRVTLS